MTEQHPTMPLPGACREREVIIKALHLGYLRAREQYQSVKQTAETLGVEKPEFFPYLVQHLFGDGSPEASAPHAVSIERGEQFPLFGYLDAAELAAGIQGALVRAPGTGMIVQLTEVDHGARQCGIHVTHGVPNEILAQAGGLDLTTTAPLEEIPDPVAPEEEAIQWPDPEKLDNEGPGQSNTSDPVH